jgi:hypothetical protein
LAVDYRAVVSLAPGAVVEIEGLEGTQIFGYNAAGLISHLRVTTLSLKGEVPLGVGPSHSGVVVQWSRLPAAAPAVSDMTPQAEAPAGRDLASAASNLFWRTVSSEGRSRAASVMVKGPFKLAFYAVKYFAEGLWSVVEVLTWPLRQMPVKYAVMTSLLILTAVGAEAAPLLAVAQQLVENAGFAQIASISALLVSIGLARSLTTGNRKSAETNRNMRASA